MSDQERAARLRSLVCNLVEKGVPLQRIHETMALDDLACLKEHEDIFIQKPEPEDIKWWGDWFMFDNCVLTYADTDLFIELNEINNAADLNEARTRVCESSANLSDFEKAMQELKPDVFEKWKRYAMELLMIDQKPVS